jgi:hypothetical protein
VYRYGVVVLAILAGALLVAVNANTNSLIPLYAIGVFTGFTLSQTGLVRHWRQQKPPRWWARATLNGVGALMTAVATVIFLVTKFTGGAWVVVIAIPALILVFSRIDKYYNQVGAELGLGSIPGTPQSRDSLVVVMIAGVSRLAEFALSTAISFGHEVVAVSVQFDDERAAGLRADWDRWNPGVTLVVLQPHSRSVAAPILEYLRSPEIQGRDVMVLIPEVEPRKWRYQVLQNQRGVILAGVLRRRSTVTVARLPFHLAEN